MTRDTLESTKEDQAVRENAFGGSEPDRRRRRRLLLEIDPPLIRAERTSNTWVQIIANLAESVVSVREIAT